MHRKALKKALTGYRDKTRKQALQNNALVIPMYPDMAATTTATNIPEAAASENYMSCVH